MDKGIHIYLDWNVYNKIEKTEDLPVEEKEAFLKIASLCETQQIICPYSNAHINDLLRGYRKNPGYIQGHLKTLATYTNHLCIVQYWGQAKVSWHYRNVEDFFFEAAEDISLLTLEEMLKEDETGFSRLPFAKISTFSD
jgi:hypothetical protein